MQKANVSEAFCKFFVQTLLSALNNSTKFDSCGMKFGQNGENELIIVSKLTLWNSHEYEDCAKPFQELGQVNRNLPGITSHFCVGTCISLPIN